MVRGRRSIERRGLAPLELVLALPILLAVLALVVNYGIVATWKVRALTVARHELWSHRTFRTGNHQPASLYWQASGAERSHGGGKLAELDDEALHEFDRVARGTLPATRVKYQDPDGLPDLFDPGRGFARGRAALSRRMPLWGKWQSYNLATDTRLIQDLWQFRSGYMSWWDDFWENGLYDNDSLRIPVIYRLQQADPELAARYVDIVNEILHADVQEALRPMWADLDDIEFRDHFAAWGGLRYNNFNPRFPASCGLDDEATRTARDILCKQIRGDPDGTTSQPYRMAREYYRMYLAIENLANAELTAEEPPSGDRQAYLQGVLQKVTPLKEACQQFRDSLPH